MDTYEIPFYKELVCVRVRKGSGLFSAGSLLLLYWK